MSTLLDAAIAYAERGWHIFPLNGKVPYSGSRGEHDATNDIERIKTWWTEHPDANIGWRLGADGYCAIDLDDKHGKTGYLEWEKQVGEKPDTLTHRTPSGGIHLIYRGELRASQSAIARGIDTRGKTGYIALPPSPGYAKILHAEPAPVPQWVIDALVQTERGERAPLNFTEDTDEAEALAHYHIRLCLDRSGPPVPGDRDTRGYLLALDLKDDGLSPERAIELLETEWGCDHDLARDKVASAWADRGSNKNEPGCNLTNNGLRHAAGLGNINDFEMPGAENKERNLRFKLASPTEQRDTPPPSYWDEHRGAHCIFPKQQGGLTILVQGEKGSHKTGVCIYECLEAIQRQGAKVLYFALEGAQGIMTARLPQALAARGMSTDDVEDSWRLLPIGLNMTLASERKQLIGDLRAQEFEPDIIVIDVLTRALGGIDINSPAAGMAIADGADHLGRAFNASVLLVTHPGKDKSRGVIGSSLQGSLGYAVWEISHESGLVTLNLAYMKDGPAEFNTLYDVVMTPAPVISEAVEQPYSRPKAGRAVSGLGLQAQIRAVLDRNPGRTFDDKEMAEKLAPYDDGSSDLLKQLRNAHRPTSAAVFREMGAAVLNGENRGAQWRWGARLAL
jgi:hypothetical protein